MAGLCGWALSSSCPPRGRLYSVNSVAGLCGWALSSSWPRPWTLSTLWLGSVAGPCPPLVLLVAAPLNSVNSVAGLCGWALSRSCPPSIQQLCGPALCPGLVLLLSSVLAAPLNSVAGLCGPALRPHLSKKDKQTTRVTQKVLCFQFSELSLLYLHPPPIYINNEQLSAILILP